MSNFHAKRQAEHGAWAFIGAFSVVIRLYSNIDLVIAQPFALAQWYGMWFLTSIPAYVQISNENVDRIAILRCAVRVAGYAGSRENQHYCLPQYVLPAGQLPVFAFRATIFHTAQDERIEPASTPSSCKFFCLNMRRSEQT